MNGDDRIRAVLGRVRRRLGAGCGLAGLAGLAGLVGMVGIGLVTPRESVAAESAAEEVQAFAVAKRAFSDGVFDVAERHFAEFAGRYPQSAQLAEARLFQAQAALNQHKVGVALELLTNHMDKAGAFADQYCYWQGKGHLQSSNYGAAAETFARLAREHTNSVLMLEASYSEAEARFKLGAMPQVIALLQGAEGNFQRAARVRANDALAARGNLLLADALLARNEFKAAEQVVAGLSETNLTPEFKWRRQYALCRIKLAGGRAAEALAHTTNLVAMAAATGQPHWLAESVAMRAEVWQRLNQLEAAAQTYEQNLAETVPAAYRRTAAVHAIELRLAQGNIPEAARRLQEFLAKHPQDAAADLTLLTLGEVHLRLAAGGASLPAEALTNAPAAGTNAVSPLAGTNHLAAALAAFDRLIGAFTNSPWLGKAHLCRGWCLWLDKKIAESLPAFAQAAERLPMSEDLAVARFKLADVQFQLNDLTNAWRHYQSVVSDFEAFPRVRNTLGDHALYQSLRVSLQLGRLAEAESAMKRLLEWFPDSVLRDRGMLLVAQGFTQAHQPAEARALFTELAKRLPASPLIPEVELAIARTYLEEKQWAGAIAQYTAWLARPFATNALRARAEFNRAWAHYQAGDLTNALALFTNFVARFPQDELAPRAQFWIGTHFYGQKDFVNAEKHFQHKLLSQNTNFAYTARMMAGRAAFARQGWKDAYDHFTAVVNDNNAVRYAPDVAAEAFFALGDTIVHQDGDPGKPIHKFVLAREAFSKIPQLFPTNHLVPRAWGRMGDCFLQMGSADAKQYESATNAYHRVLQAPDADVTARSQAGVGIGHALKFMAKTRDDPGKTALLKAAFDHYYQLVIEKNLRPGETPDPFWFKEAAMNAGLLAEQAAQWEAALNIYTRLGTAIPHLRSSVDKKIEQVRKQLSAHKS
ncbi:MAG: tetratricopeptide repeat protein [Verrucomicrobia bacterium]|nr:tetratricopeptide repeat protein [Verrucomicrobiota bacterium]